MCVLLRAVLSGIYQIFVNSLLGCFITSSQRQTRTTSTQTIETLLVVLDKKMDDSLYVTNNGQSVCVNLYRKDHVYKFPIRGVLLFVLF